MHVHVYTINEGLNREALPNTQGKSRRVECTNNYKLFNYRGSNLVLQVQQGKNKNVTKDYKLFKYKGSNLVLQVQQGKNKNM